MDKLDDFLVLAYYLSKYSGDAAEDLGYHSQSEAMQDISSIFKMDIKHRRDEFDVLTDSNRVGFHNRDVRQVIQKHFDCLEKYDYVFLTDKAQEILVKRTNTVYDVEEQSDDQITYSLKDVRFERCNYSIYELRRKYNKKTLLLSPDFQRADVWKKIQKSELIESIIMGLPLPVLYFSKDESSTIKVIDGKQRLNTLFQFLNDEFKLSNLKLLKDLNGKKFSQLSEVTQTMIEDYSLHVNEILPPTPDRVMFDIFERVNRCGTKLNKQEIRNALYPGPGMEMIRYVAKSEEFEIATDSALKKDNRMKAEYILTRFFAFDFLFNNIFSYSGDIDQLIKQTYLKLNKSNEHEIKEYKTKAKNALRNSYFYLGENAFRKPDVDKNGTYCFTNTPINMNIFETFMILMTQLPQESIESKEFIKNKIVQIFYNADFMESIGNRRDGVNKVQQRFKLINQVRSEMLNVK